MMFRDTFADLDLRRGGTMNQVIMFTCLLALTCSPSVAQRVSQSPPGEPQDVNVQVSTWKDLLLKPGQRVTLAVAGDGFRVILDQQSRVEQLSSADRSKPSTEATHKRELKSHSHRPVANDYALLFQNIKNAEREFQGFMRSQQTFISPQLRRPLNDVQRQLSEAVKQAESVRRRLQHAPDVATPEVYEVTSIGNDYLQLKNGDEEKYVPLKRIMAVERKQAAQDKSSKLPTARE